jgi:ubiquinone/menaquinone biosynthesis C-methylase UbiE
MTTRPPAPPPATPAPAGPLRASTRRHTGAAGQRRRWSRRARSWNEGVAANAGLTAVIDAVVTSVAARPGMRVLDMGCGSGQVTIPLARAGAEVIAVDVSPAMIRLLRENAAREALTNIRPVVDALENLRLPAASLDAVVSNYALHHLADDDKRRLLRAATVWLRPGGHLIIGDLMLGRGGSAHDRAVIRGKITALGRRGPGGWWRIAKNSWRFMARTCERPLPLSAWAQLLEETGFADVSGRSVVAEAGLVRGSRPA